MQSTTANYFWLDQLVAGDPVNHSGKVPLKKLASQIVLFTFYREG